MDLRMNPLTFEELFRSIDEKEYDGWDLEPPPYKKMCKEENEELIPKKEQAEDMDTSEKRKSPIPSIPKKKQKTTRGDELIEDPELRAAATKILDQFKKSPGIIKLDFSNEATTGLVPLPDGFLPPYFDTNWRPSELNDGDLQEMLKTEDISRSVYIPKICGKVNKTQIYPRHDALPTVLKNLYEPDRKNDQYIGFAASIANILRRCDDELGEDVAKSIITVIEEQALSQIPNALVGL